MGPGPGWTRSRVLFLAISGAIALAILVGAKAVLLPFVLAIIIAFVLTPFVALCEKVRIPRSVSIIIVYIVSGFLVYLGIALVAPRLVAEIIQLGKETPALARKLSSEYGPALEREVSGLVELLAPPANQPPKPQEPALKFEREPDGNIGLEVGSGIDIIRESETHWRLAAVDHGKRFHLAELITRSTEDTLTYIRQNAMGVVKIGHAIVTSITRGIFLLFMTLMVAGYLMHTRDGVVAFFRSLPPPAARVSFDRLLERLNRGLSGVVRGQLLICLVNGVLSAIGFWLLGLNYWPLLALIAAVMSIIPIFGSILSTIPAVLIGLTQDFWIAFWVLIWILAIHQIEANLLNPKIIGVAAKIHPVMVVFSLIVGEHFFGLWGALLAVPVLSVMQSLFQHFRYESLPDAPDSLMPPPPQTPGVAVAEEQLDLLKGES